MSDSRSKLSASRPALQRALCQAMAVLLVLAQGSMSTAALAQNPVSVPGVPQAPTTPHSATLATMPATPGASFSTPSPAPAAGPTEPQPFGASLFTGNFAGQRQDGINPNYVVLPGDRVLVNAWGMVALNDVFVVDSQGNIFVPQIGPIHVAGVTSSQLTDAVRRGFNRVYRAGFDVYTNLMTASPVAVYVTGGVVRPGRYAGVPSDTPLFYLAQAGGIDPTTGSYRHVKVLRRGELVAEVDLYDFLLRGTLETVQFADGDVILVERRGPTVQVQGHRTAPELVEFASERFTGQELLDVVVTSATLAEITLEGMREGARVMRAYPRETFRTTQLSSGDIVTLRGIRLTGEILVRLEGEFYGPSVLAVHRGARLLDVLTHVAVDPDLADLGGIHVKRASVAAAQRDAINDALNRLERSALLALSSTTGETTIRVQEATLVRQFVESARNIQPLGNVVTTHEGQTRNLMLEDGDVIVIPTRTTVVLVAGEVHMSQAVMYEPGLTAGECIQRSGGVTNHGERRRVLILRPSAEIVVTDNGYRVHPGDQVLVLPHVDRKILQNFADVTSVLYQIAVGAAVVLRMF